MPSSPEAKLTAETLVRLELAGKHEAAGRYDAIIWRIRVGYAVVLYGTMGVFLGKGDVKPSSVTAGVLLLISGFSLLGYLMDLTYRVRQLRVVGARNRLSDLALNLVTGQAIDAAELRQLLHVSGESAITLELSALLRATTLIFFFYAATPMLAAMFRLWR